MACRPIDRLNPPVDRFDITTLGAEIVFDVSSLDNHDDVREMGRRGLKHIKITNVHRGVRPEPRKLADFLRQFPRLKVLDLRELKSTYRTDMQQIITAIFKYMPNMNFVTHLYLGPCGKSFGLMMWVLRRFPNLLTLSMPNSGLRLDEYNILWAMWENLTCLDISKCKVNDPVIHSIASNLNQLQELDISDPANELSNLGLAHLKNMQYLKKLVLLNCSFCDADERFLQDLSSGRIPLTTLHVSGHQMYGHQICKSIGDSRFQLTELKVGLGLTYDGLMALLNNGKTSYVKLEFLYPIDTSEMADLWPALVQIQRSCQGLQSVVFTDVVDRDYREEYIEDLRNARSRGR